MLHIILIIILASLSATAQGQVMPIYDSPKRADYIEAGKALQEIEFLERVADSVNASVRLPTKVPLRLQECGEVNASYSQTSRAITLCYELVEEIFSGAMKDFSNVPPEKRMEFASGALMVVLFHEVGHGLLHTLQIPILGKEEDAADSIANHIILHTRNPYPSIVGSAWFLTRGTRQPGVRDYADAHSLNPQRAFNMLCYAVGMDAAKFRSLAERVGLTEDRALRCPDEYRQLERSTRLLLRGHLTANAP